MLLGVGVGLIVCAIRVKVGDWRGRRMEEDLGLKGVWMGHGERVKLGLVMYV